MVMIPIASSSGQQSQPIWRQTFDPNGRVILNWNRFLFVIGIFNFGIDLLVFFIVMVDDNSLYIDFKLASIILSLRMVGDSCQFLGIVVKFRTAIYDPGNGVFKRQELIRDPIIIAKRYLNSSFIIDLLAALPLLQVYIKCKLPSMRTSPVLFPIVDFLGYTVMIVTIQFFPRVYVLFPFRKKVIETGDIIMRPAWSGTLYCLLYYIMLSHLMGAVYYYVYIVHLMKCKQEIYKKKKSGKVFVWDGLLRECGIYDQLEQGVLFDIYKNKIGFRSFLQRCMYCFSWGLKSLSSMGQNFDTCASVADTIISFSVTICGLLLFAGLIAQMQTCIQSMESGEEQLMVRQREVEDWAKTNQMPPELKKRLRQTADLRALRGIDDDIMLGLLPTDLQRDIRRHLYSHHACNLPFFANLDRELAHSFIGHLRSFFCSKETMRHT